MDTRGGLAMGTRDGAEMYFGRRAASQAGGLQAVSFIDNCGDFRLRIGCANLLPASAPQNPL